MFFTSTRKGAITNPHAHITQDSDSRHIPNCWTIIAHVSLESARVQIHQKRRLCRKRKSTEQVIARSFTLKTRLYLLLAATRLAAKRVSFFISEHWKNQQTAVTALESLKTFVLSQRDCISALLTIHRQRLQEHCFSWSVTGDRQRTCLEFPCASTADPFGQPSSIQNRSGGRLDGHWISNLNLEVSLTLMWMPMLTPSSRFVRVILAQGPC